MFKSISSGFPHPFTPRCSLAQTILPAYGRSGQTPGRVLRTPPCFLQGGRRLRQGRLQAQTKENNVYGLDVLFINIVGSMHSFGLGLFVVQEYVVLLL